MMNARNTVSSVASTDLIKIVRDKEDWLLATPASLAAAIATGMTSSSNMAVGALTATSLTLTTGNASVPAGTLSVASTITSAAPDTTRLGLFAVTITPATAVAIAANGSIAGVRGSVTLTTGKSITDGYLYGAQGKLTLDGATVAVGSDHIAGVYGQLSMNGTTLTSGHTAAVMGSIQATPTSANIDLFYGESATGNIINSFFKAFGKSSYVFDFESNVHTQMSTTGTVGTTNAKGWLKVLVEGAVRYIPLADSVS